MLVLLLAASLVFATGGQEKKEAGVWKPSKPLQVIVPWGAGGSTDQVIRVVAGELEGPLGQKVVVVNQPGASGSVGTKGAWDATHDGYTWASGAAGDLGGYKVLGLLDTQWSEWVLYVSVANIAVVAVNADTPYQTFDDLLKAFKDNPGQIPVATAGVSSAGHNAIEAIRAKTGIEYKHVTYDGGNPAVIATVGGEAQVTTQLAVEEADMLRGKKLRALAVMGDKPLELKGYGTIPPITNWIPDLKPAGNYFGMWIPKDAPQEVIQTMGQLWDTVIKNSQKLRDYANERGAVFDPAWGQAAVDKAFPFLQQVVWTYYDAGKAKLSPDAVGIPRP
jgi:tripartite-type tricarboxylate transporter receptor subunit TctC